MTIRKLTFGPQRANQTQTDPKVDKENRMQVVFTTGFKGRRNGPFGPYNEELVVDAKSMDLTRFIGGPLLANHDQNIDSVIGRIVDAKFENNRLVGTVEFSTDPAAQAIKEKVATKMLRDISIGYSMDAADEIPGNLTSDPPTLRVTRSTLFEASIVSIGFDPHAKFRSNEFESKETVITRKSPTGAESISMADKAELKKEIQLEERARENELRQITQQTNLDEKFVREWMDADITPDEARKRALLVISTRGSPLSQVNGFHKGDYSSASHEDQKRDAIVDAIACRIDRTMKPTEGARALGSGSLVRLLEQRYTRGLYDSNDHVFVKRAMSNSDLPMILSNSAEKAMQNRYGVADKSYKQWATEDTRRNYKTGDILRLSQFGSLEAKPEGAEYMYSALAEEREQVKLSEYGRIISLTNQMIVNDDLNALQSLANEGASMSANLDNKLVYAVLRANGVSGDGENYFSAAHGNLLATGTINDTSMADALKKLRKMTSVAGQQVLNLMGKYLICGPELEVVAKKYLTTIAPTSSTDVNIFAGTLQVIVDAEIDNDEFYVVADKAALPSVTLYRLEGSESPIVQSRVDFSTDNLQLKVSYSAAAGAIEWRSVIKGKAT